jgi:predicted RNA binding protein YcfA (HicA-like mRNA interferase family)
MKVSEILRLLHEDGWVLMRINGSIGISSTR